LHQQIARTNTVVVTGPEDTLKVIDDVLTQLDANPLLRKKPSSSIT